MKTAIIIPTFNEEKSIAKVICALQKCATDNDFNFDIILADNNSSDNTIKVAKKLDTKISIENEKGYGATCLKAITLVENDTTHIAFIDGDFSDFPEEISLLINELIAKKLDLVIGSRVLGQKEKGSLTVQQIFGNWLATRLIRLFWGYNYSDLGPFRIIKKEAYDKLNMQDRNFGWTIEMQIRALKHKLAIGEVAVKYRKRIGKSKVSGTIKGSVMAGVIIIKTIFKEWLSKK